MRKHVLWAILALIASVVLVGCNENKAKADANANVFITIQSPTAPGPVNPCTENCGGNPNPGSTVTKVTVTPNPADLTFTNTNGQCLATQEFKAKVDGTGDYSHAVVWTSDGGSINALSGVFTASPGTTSAKVWARSSQGGVLSEAAIVNISGSCPSNPTTMFTIAPSQISLVGPCPGGTPVTVTLSTSPSQSVTWNWTGTSFMTLSTTSGASTTATITGQGSGTIVVNGGGQSVQVPVNVSAPTGCPQPPSVVSVQVIPETVSCSPGQQASFTATVQVTGNAATTVSWHVPSSNVASVATQSSNAITLNCLASGDLTITARATADSTKSDTGHVVVSQTQQPPTCPLTVSSTSVFQGQSVILSWTPTNTTSSTATGSGWSGSKSVSGNETVAMNQLGTFTLGLRCVGSGGTTNSVTHNVTVNPPVQSSCTPSQQQVDYAPDGGTLSGGQTATLNASNYGTCTPYWYTDKPSRFHLTGATMIDIGGVTYWAGSQAVLRAIAGNPGTAQVCVQIDIKNPQPAKCYTWTVP